MGAPKPLSNPVSPGCVRGPLTASKTSSSFTSSGLTPCACTGAGTFRKSLNGRRTRKPVTETALALADGSAGVRQSSHVWAAMPASHRRIPQGGDQQPAHAARLQPVASPSATARSEARTRPEAASARYKFSGANRRRPESPADSRSTGRHCRPCGNGHPGVAGWPSAEAINIADLAKTIGSGTEIAWQPVPGAFTGALCPECRKTGAGVRAASADWTGGRHPPDPGVARGRALSVDGADGSLSCAALQ